MTGKILQTLSRRDRELGPFAAKPPADNANWHLRRDDDGVAWLLLDCVGARVNTLSAAVLRELSAMLDTLEKERPKALVLRSAKDNNFCAGADLKEIRELKDGEQARQLLEEGHRIFTRLAKLRCPTIAVIHGTCLGGGLELALACDYRIAVPGSSLGFPEIRLGLHPGLGGTARSTALMNPVTAMTLMLTGKTAADRKAKKMGLVDAVVEERHVSAALRAAVSGRMKRRRRGLSGWLMNTLPLRKLVARRMRGRSAKKASPRHYPAPEALIALWEKHGGSSRAMLRHEVDSFVELLLTDTAANLIRVFFLREKMKSLAAPKDAVGKHEFNHVHVIGAGAMGGDIAGWCALQGLTVTLFDMKAEVVARAVGNAAKLCDRRRMNSAEKRDVLDRLVPDLKNAAVSRADVVIEAVPEKTDIKRQVYTEIEPLMKEGALLATNTSSIPLDALQENLRHPDRFVGLHFFNPVAMMQLVEVVSHREAREESLAQARAFTGRIGKLPAPVASAPGFLVNRALMPYLMEALLMLDEGIAPEMIDNAAEDFGMPVGPVELADQVGLDICVGVADMLRDRLDAELPVLPEWFREKVDAGNLGRKTGKGLYIWRHGKALKNRTEADMPAPEDITDRLLLPMLNACMACLGDRVIEDEEVLDGAMIFGTGFAPFRGGPMHYARTRGFDGIRAALEDLAHRHGARFTPHHGWGQG